MANASQPKATQQPSTANSQFPRVNSDADATPEQITEDLMLENLMRVESQVNLVRYQYFLFNNNLLIRCRNTESIVHCSLMQAVISPSIFDNVEFLKQLTTVSYNY